MLDDKKLYSLIGDRIQRLRRMQSPALSQERLAKVLGLTRTSVTNIERGKQKLSLDAVYKLCEAFGIDIADLMPSISEITRNAEQSVVVAGQAYEVPAKTASTIKRLLPDAGTLPLKTRRGRDL